MTDAKEISNCGLGGNG